MAKDYYQLHITAIKKGPEGFKLFELKPDRELPYKAGQYLTLVIQQEEEIRRSYSMSSAPLLREPITIGVKRVENGLFSRLLVDKAEVGDMLIASGTGGRFVLPEDLQRVRQIYFFAAGSGITPVYSMIKTLLFLHPHIRVDLIYSNASPLKTIFLKELQQLDEQFSQLYPVFLFSNHFDLSRARLNRDLLLQFIRSKTIASQEETLFYVCGPESYNRMVTYILHEQGYLPDQVKKENFWVPPSRIPAVPPDTLSHQAVIYYGRDKYQFPVHYPDSILKAAQKSGILLPYSCEAGRCGNCIALCEKGKIWHSMNEVLTEKELEKGWILTCTAHPVESDVQLRI